MRHNTQQTNLTETAAITNGATASALDIGLFTLLLKNSTERWLFGSVAKYVGFPAIALTMLIETILNWRKAKKDTKAQSKLAKWGHTIFSGIKTVAAVTAIALSYTVLIAFTAPIFIGAFSVATAKEIGYAGYHGYKWYKANNEEDRKFHKTSCFASIVSSVLGIVLTVVAAFVMIKAFPVASPVMAGVGVGASSLGLFARLGFWYQARRARRQAAIEAIQNSDGIRTDARRTDANKPASPSSDSGHNVTPPPATAKGVTPEASEAQANPVVAVNPIPTAPVTIAAPDTTESIQPIITVKNDSRIAAKALPSVSVLTQHHARQPEQLAPVTTAAAVAA